MSIFYNLKGPARKALVVAISEILNLPVKYNGAPTFSYTVGDYIIDKNGTITRHTGFNHKQTNELIAALEARGYEEMQPEDVTPEMIPKIRHRGLTIEVPNEGFSEQALENLRKIIASKDMLIQKALGIDGDESNGVYSLTFDVKEDKLCFPWFILTGTDGEMEAYARFVHALCEMAKKQKRVTAKEDGALENEKFTFRLFLIRLGFKGPESKQARSILLRYLSGNSSWKNGAPSPVEMKYTMGNNGLPSKAAVEARKARYTPGSRVELVSMDDPYTRLKPGDQGTVTYVDSIGTVFVDWDSGSNLGVAYGTDQIKKL